MLGGVGVLQPCADCCAHAKSFLDNVITVVSVLAVPTAAFTFWLGYRQKERERTLSYYHKVVVDVVISDVFRFFDEQIRQLSQAGIEARDGINSGRVTMPRAVKSVITSFSTELFKLQDQIADRTIVFDEHTTEEIKQEFEIIQDRVTGWFNDLYQSKRRGLEELRSALRDGQRRVIKHLYRGQFRNF